MKYKIVTYILFIVLLAHITSRAIAQSTTKSVDLNTPTPEKSLLNDQIQILKDKIATKVAEISKSNKQVLVGTVQTTDEAGFSILSKGTTVKALIDSDMTTYENIIDPSKKITLKNIKKDAYVLLDGVMLGNEFSVKTVYLQLQYEIIAGTIKNIDSKQYLVDVITSDQETITIDIEKSTVQRKIDSQLSIVKAGFSDYAVGDRIQCVIPKRPAESIRASGVRTLIIPDNILPK